MAMKTILVPIPDTAVDPAAIEIALMVAKAVTGHVEGLYIETPAPLTLRAGRLGGYKATREVGIAPAAQLAQEHSERSGGTRTCRRAGPGRVQAHLRRAGRAGVRGRRFRSRAIFGVIELDGHRLSPFSSRPYTINSSFVTFSSDCLGSLLARGAMLGEPLNTRRFRKRILADTINCNFIYHMLTTERASFDRAPLEVSTGPSVYLPPAGGCSRTAGAIR